MRRLFKDFVHANTFVCKLRLFLLSTYDLQFGVDLFQLLMERGAPRQWLDPGCFSRVILGQVFNNNRRISCK